MAKLKLLFHKCSQYEGEDESHWLVTTEDGCAGGSGLMSAYTSHQVPSAGGRCITCKKEAIHQTYEDGSVSDLPLLWGGFCEGCCPPPSCEMCSKPIFVGKRYYSVLEGPAHGLYCETCVVLER